MSQNDFLDQIKSMDKKTAAPFWKNLPLPSPPNSKSR